MYVQASVRSSRVFEAHARQIMWWKWRLRVSAVYLLNHAARFCARCRPSAVALGSETAHMNSAMGHAAAPKNPANCRPWVVAEVPDTFQQRGDILWILVWFEGSSITAGISLLFRVLVVGVLVVCCCVRCGVVILLIHKSFLGAYVGNT